MKRTIILRAVALLLVGCTPKVPVLTPEIQAQMIVDIKSGNAVLDCNIACTGPWFFGGHEELRQFYAAQDWQALGTHVLKIGLQMDLGYFYLGRAAEGMGADEAALKYYRIAGALATGSMTSLQCAHTECDGISLPADLYPRIAAVQADIDRKNSPPTPQLGQSSSGQKTHHKRKAAPKPADDWITPPPITH
jgi:hypothetical protein